jgi:hypothetical protein
MYSYINQLIEKEDAHCEKEMHFKENRPSQSL